MMKNKYRYWMKVLMLLLIIAGQMSVVSAEEVIKIGVLQYVEHVSLNANYQGFIDGLKELGYEEGKNIAIEYVNAAADNANLQSMSEKLVKNNDYLFAIATPAAQALANVAGKAPLYFSAVTDPVAAGLVDNLEKPSKSVTGTIDASPIDEQVKLLQQLQPKAKTIGLLYNSGETNSQAEAKRAQTALEKQGLKVEHYTVTSTNDINQVMQSMVGKVDAIFTVTDNTIASAMSLVGDLALEAKLAIIGGSTDMILENGLATYGLDYYSLGKQTAAMLVKQLKAGGKGQTLPVESAAEQKLVINEKVAAALNIDVSAVKKE
ncbi:ABC transporter substrate binding protein [Tuanshanicoccus lijuaniae]|uniref:ABC transporter substrate binding protein n=1 Tax=Aerococcaceae bacterium zg-1292 TaxID=2774330 RepID=UPI001BD904C1|nr:ABC transporter substrate-binding protein [Aerococcaceae bacterium zg-BR9]MBS4456155.1 ABC transporter substrate-binding protein [Aerococcaceae bacterium zg-A91]MBS4458006.1 ABC transporter substrate-binding protein [Aerococcaceae bacterium zg-BR33]